MTNHNILGNSYTHTHLQLFEVRLASLLVLREVAWCQSQLELFLYPIHKLEQKTRFKWQCAVMRLGESTLLLYSHARHKNNNEPALIFRTISGIDVSSLDKSELTTTFCPSSAIILNSSWLIIEPTPTAMDLTLARRNSFIMLLMSSFDFPVTIETSICGTIPRLPETAKTLRMVADMALPTLRFPLGKVT